MSLRALRRRVAADRLLVARQVDRTRAAVVGLRLAVRRVPPLAWVGGGLLAGLLAARLPLRALAAMAATTTAWGIRLASTPWGAVMLTRARAARNADKAVPPASGPVHGH
ncbi:MAG: hypothetical protein KF823_10155 [Xanthomonadales bacterium]|nr:hypothetical protein [Xanthomonadales bacterium]